MRSQPNLGQSLCVGIREKGSSTKGAIGLHTGSDEHYVQATAWIERSRGVAFGAVSPEIERVEIRNERGEVSPGRIIPLPPDLGEEYRAAWGVATCEEECSLIGYDQHGRSIEPSMIRPRRRDLSPKDTLELLRTHCDNGLMWDERFMAFLREGEATAEWVRRLHLASVGGFRPKSSRWLRKVRRSPDPGRGQ